MGQELKVEYKQLKTKADELDSIIEQVKAHKAACKTAGETAVAAGGGTTTQVGDAINRCIADISDKEFDAVMSVITGFANAMRDAASNYEKFDNNLTQSIIEIAGKRQQLLETQNGTANTAQ